MCFWQQGNSLFFAAIFPSSLLVGVPYIISSFFRLNNRIEILLILLFTVKAFYCQIYSEQKLLLVLPPTTQQALKKKIALVRKYNMGIYNDLLNCHFQNHSHFPF